MFFLWAFICLYISFFINILPKFSIALIIPLVFFITLFYKEGKRNKIVLLITFIIGLFYGHLYFQNIKTIYTKDFTITRQINRKKYTINTDNKKALLFFKNFKLKKTLNYKTSLKLYPIIKQNISKNDIKFLGNNIFYKAKITNNIKYRNIKNYQNTNILKNINSGKFFLLKEIDKSIRGFIGVLIFGEKENLQKNIKSLIYNSSVIHVFVISGLHIGVVIGLISFLFSFLPIKRYKKLILFFILLLLYSFSVSFSPSIVRSIIMFSFLTLSFEFERLDNRINTIFIAASLIILIWPYMIFNIGFYYSFAATLGIILYSKYFRIKTKNKIRNTIIDTIAVSIFATIFTYPISLYFIGKISIMTIFYTILISPIIGFFVITSFILFPFIGIPPINKFFTWVLLYTKKTLVFLLKIFNTIDINIYSYNLFSIKDAFFLYIAIGLTLVFIKKKEKTTSIIIIGIATIWIILKIYTANEILIIEHNKNYTNITNYKKTISIKTVTKKRNKTNKKYKYNRFGHYKIFIYPNNKISIFYKDNSIYINKKRIKTTLIFGNNYEDYNLFIRFVANTICWNK